MPALTAARKAGVPIVPIVIKNTDYLMGKGTGVARPGTIEFVIPRPVPTTGCSTDEDVKKLVENVESLIAAELGATPAGRRTQEVAVMASAE